MTGSSNGDGELWQRRAERNHARRNDLSANLQKPGQFDHFVLQMPDRMIAGEDFIIQAQVYDSNNNLITNFSESGKEFKVNIRGSAVVQPSTLSARHFSGGTANISII